MAYESWMCYIFLAFLSNEIIVIELILVCRDEWSLTMTSGPWDLGGCRE